MARVRLKEQESYEFCYKTTIKVRDINYGNHLSNDALVGLLHEARIDLLHKMGLGELDLGNGVTGLILSDLVVNYRGQGYMNDEIEIHTHAGDISTSSFRFYYKVTRGETILALAESGMAAFNYDTNSIDELPKPFLKGVEAAQGVKP